MPEFRSDKGMIRGDIDIKSATNATIACVKWLDNTSVHIISSFDSGMTTTNVTCRKKGQSDKINIKCPTVVKSYNENMGGVDKYDRLKVAYEVDRRSKTRFYLRIIFDMMDQLLVNANILYNSLDKVQKMSSREFRLHVVRALCEESKCRKRSTKVCDTQAHKKAWLSSHHLEQTTVSHLPAVLSNSNRRRCALYKIKKFERKAGFECRTCNVGLCLTQERNCFFEYHQPEN